MFGFLKFAGIFVFNLLIWPVLSFALGKTVQHPGHLKPFGLSGPFESIDEIDGYPDPKYFFSNYVLQIKPLKMTKAAKDSPALMLWTDSYFMSLSSLADFFVSVENDKIEDRKKPILSMTFHSFLEVYNTSDNYLVASIPPPLSSDVLLPFPLQCPKIYEELLLANVMWMSSGGTASVVHIDSADNIICSLRGSKQIILIDPQKYSKQVMLEHPDEGYSDIDVKKVNYTKYLGLANVSYHAVNITPGDCLFIPFQWIHQVVSFNSNIAINTWWDHHRNEEISFDGCSSDQNQPISLSQVTFHGISSYDNQLRSELEQYLVEDIDVVQFYRIFLTESDLITVSQAVMDYLDKIFHSLDVNNSGLITKLEIEKLSSKDWTELEIHYSEFLKLLLTSKREFRTEL